jgi:hypothetical protein
MDPDIWPPLCYADDGVLEDNSTDTVNAIIIAPEYERPIKEAVDNCLRNAIHQYLMDASILPKSVSAAQRHVSELRAALCARDIDLTSEEYGAQPTLKRTIAKIRSCARLCKRGKLFMYFCGHGVSTSMASDNIAHGHLLLRGAEKVAWEQIDAALRAENFTGTLVQVLNTCHAGRPDPTPANASSVRSATLEGSDVPPYKVIRLTSSRWYDSQTQDQGVAAGEEILRFVRLQPPLPWSKWGEFFKVFEITDNVNSIPDEFCAF